MTLDFDVFDADNHYYEATDAFIRHLPPHRSKLVQWANVLGCLTSAADQSFPRLLSAWLIRARGRCGGRTYPQRVAVGSAPSPFLSPGRRSPRRTRRSLPWILGTVAVVLLGLAAAAWTWSGARLAADASALARVDVQAFGGTLVRAQAVGPDGRMIPLSVAGGRLTPRVQLKPGEPVSVEVLIRRPGWLGWALGSNHVERLTLRAPVAGTYTALPSPTRFTVLPFITGLAEKRQSLRAAMIATAFVSAIDEVASPETTLCTASSSASR